MEYIEAFDNPVTVPAEHMEKLSGDYGPRHIEFRDGSLWYLRDGTSRTEFTKLTPISNDTYMMEGVIYFRMQFEYDDEGRSARIVGMYDNCYRDEYYCSFYCYIRMEIVYESIEQTISNFHYWYCRTLSDSCTHI